MASKAQEFWSKLEGEPTIESMMLNKEAAGIDPKERQEILSLCPPVDARDVVELGAGIGRFTRDIADKQARSIKAYDFIQTSCDANAKTNADRPNISAHCQDVKTLELPDNSVDVVFSNWLFMYLNDEEVTTVFSRMVRWLRPGGHVFLRESCDAPSSTSLVKDMGENPTIYRSKQDYDRLLQATGLVLLTEGLVQAYVEIGCHTQNYWKLEKALSLPEEDVQRAFHTQNYWKLENANAEC